jgi:hypothetical protein
MKPISSRRRFLSLPGLGAAALFVRKGSKKQPKPSNQQWLIGEATSRVVISVPGWQSTGLDRTLDFKLPPSFGSTGRLIAIETDRSGKAVGDRISVTQHEQRALFVVASRTDKAPLPSGDRLFSVYEIPGRPSTPAGQQVKLLADARDEDDNCFVIETPMFRCYFQQYGSAISSLLDRDGKDWINYRAAPGVGPRGSFGAYRGMPNFPAPPGMFHPGLNLATTQVISSHPQRIELRSTSKSEPRWAYQTIIYQDRIEMTVLDAPVDYWWLFEGTPGGESATGGTIDFRTMRAGESDIPAAQSWSGKTPWAGFRVPRLGSNFGRTLIVAHTATSQPKSSYYLANGIGSPIGTGEEGAMTVFGFGRDSGKAYVDHRTPQTFTFAMIDATDANQVTAVAQSLRLGPISVGAVQKRPA